MTTLAAQYAGTGAKCAEPPRPQMLATREYIQRCVHPTMFELLTCVDNLATPLFHHDLQDRSGDIEYAIKIHRHYFSPLLCVHFVKKSWGLRHACIIEEDVYETRLMYLCES